MLLLTSTSDKLQVVTTSTANVDVHASWVDNASGTITPGRTNTAIASATTTDVVASPGASTQRNVQTLVARNKHASTSNTVTVRHTDGTTTVELFSYTLGAGEQLQYVDGGGWAVLDASGNIKTTGIGTGRQLRQTIYTSGSAATHTFAAGCTSAVIEAIAGGGGGGGATFSSPNMGFGAGGASGGYLKKTIANPGATATYTVGGGGSAGANTGATGGTGTDTTVTVGATTYTAKGGLGGVGMVAAAAVGVAAGGAGVLPTNGDINMPGEPGNNGVRVSATVGVSGAGGSGVLGNGGVGQSANAAGVAGRGFGGGGSGAAAVSASSAGGAGATGAVIITEFS
jgi:hypothetical protein